MGRQTGTCPTRRWPVPVEASDDDGAPMRAAALTHPQFRASQRRRRPAHVCVEDALKGSCATAGRRVMTPPSW